jgi:ABC-type iron transport system FetAB ATPase subunit
MSNANYLRRDDAERMTLDNISISIPAGSKIGLCGRTGSGKSSLLLTLFNLLTPTSGSITIDNLDISTLRRETLRSRLICIAEEPFLFPSSVRDNLTLDCTTLTDEDMMAVLQQTGLWESVTAKGGLDAMMEDVHLSQGSKQLFNIARALLRKEQGRVLVMDEATSRCVSFPLPFPSFPLSYYSLFPSSSPFPYFLLFHILTRLQTASTPKPTSKSNLSSPKNSATTLSFPSRTNWRLSQDLTLWV